MHVLYAGMVLQTFLWLGDFSRQEADQFLDGLLGQGVLSQSDRNEVYDVVGTRPGTLQLLLQQFPDARHADATLTPASWLLKEALPGAEEEVKRFMSPEYASGAQHAIPEIRRAERLQLLKDLARGKGTRHWNTFGTVVGVFFSGSCYVHCACALCIAPMPWQW